MYLKKKLIRGKKYTYAVKAIRLPDNRTIPIEVLKKDRSRKDLEAIFMEKEAHEHVKYAIKQFGTDSIFTKESLQQLEEIKLKYKKYI